MSQQDYLYDWVFHFNPFTEQWAAIPSDKYNAYWDNYKHPDVYRSKDLKTLLSLLHKTKGDKEAIEKLTDECK